VTGIRNLIAFTLTHSRTPVLLDDITLQTLYPTNTAASEHRPVPGGHTPELKGLYLKESFPDRTTRNRPFIYANFVSSLDGRIALPADSGRSFQTPSHMTTSADWSLFTELQAHADCLLTHSGYLRALQLGKLGNALTIPQEADSDYLHQWRTDNGLTRQPALIIVSRSLDFVFPESIDLDAQPTTVITTPQADSARRVALEQQGLEVRLVERSDLITAKDVLDVLLDKHYHRLYLQTGPEFLYSVLEQQLLNRLYLTSDLSLTAGMPFLSMVDGPALKPATNMRLRSMILATETSDGNDDTETSIAQQQLFSSYSPDWAKQPG